MKRVIACFRMGCEIGAVTGFLTTAFVVMALAGNRNWDHNPAVFVTWGSWTAGIGFATGFFVGVSIVIDQGRKASANQARGRRAPEHS